MTETPVERAEPTDSDLHAAPLSEVWRALGSGPDGLSELEATARKAAKPEPGRSRAMHVLAELAESVTEPLQLLLVLVAVLSAVFGQLSDAIAIFGVITLVASIEAITEARAKRALRALQDLSSPAAMVRRDGAARLVAREALVCGDVLLLETGMLLAADARVVQADGLASDESALSGEPLAAAKGPDPVDADAPLSERTSMLYAGTVVVAGSGEAIVCAIGPQTQLGRLGQLVQAEREPPTPLQRAMSELARAALILAVAASVLVPLLGIIRGQPARQMLLDGLTLAFATIPEELPILVTVLVAVGGLRLAKRGVLLRKLRAAESIGAITVLVSDKTGTLTENRLSLKQVSGDRQRVIDVALAAHGGPAQGEGPLDLALRQASTAPPWTGERQRFAFDPVRKRESAAWTGDGGVRIAAKGAPESVLAACTISSDEHRQTLGKLEEYTGAGLRVIAVAERNTLKAPADAQDAEQALTFVGLLAFEDPLREGVTEALTQLARAGVRTIILSGDHPLTVQGIARQAGLRAPKVLIGGAPLAKLTDDELDASLKHDVVLARATPEDKLRIVRRLQHAGEIVAVTGDGINDAPALAAANVGIAMGARGTDLAREAADLVLTDDAYPTILTAVAGGRSLATQLRRAVAFYLGAKVALVSVIAIPLAFGLPSPFDPVQIVLLELFMDLGASVAFVSEPPSSGAMTRPPRDPARRFLDRAQQAAIALTALALTAAVLPAYLLVRGRFDADAGGTAALAAWLIAHAAIAWTLRTRPRLPVRANPTFPLWALIATVTAAFLTLTSAGHAISAQQLPAGAAAITLGAALGGALLAAAGRNLLRIPQRL